MNFDFEQTMKEASDAELIRIVVTNCDEYQEAAITAAQTELSKRNIPEQKFVTIKGCIEKDNEIKEFKRQSSLEVYWKILAFIFPGFIQLILAGSFKANGYDRKANEVARWTFYGIGFYIALALFTALPK